MKKVSFTILAGLTAAIILAVPANGAQGPYHSGTYACGAKYVSGHTSGNASIWVNAAGAYASSYFAYPMVGTVAEVGDHSGTISSYGSIQITSWGFSGCSYK